MANPNFYFKVKPGDEERQLRGVSCEGEGLYAKLRRIAFDRDPVGFLVDDDREPLDYEYLADEVYLTNGRFRAIFDELLKRKVIRTADKFREWLQANPNGWANMKLATYVDILKCIKAPLDTVYVVPTLVDDHLDTRVGQKTSRLRGRKEPVQEELTYDSDPVDGGRTRGGRRGALTHTQTAPVHAQISESESEVRVQTPEAKAFGKEKESPSTAHALTLATQTAAPWSWAKHLYECDRLRKWRAQLPAGVLDDEDRFRAYFWAEFGYSYDVFIQAAEVYEHGPGDPPLPQSCLDGQHVIEDGRCVNCKARRTA